MRVRFNTECAFKRVVFIRRLKLKLTDFKKKKKEIEGESKKKEKENILSGFTDKRNDLHLLLFSSLVLKSVAISSGSTMKRVKRKMNQKRDSTR